jgi:O-antigen/teichoic acid export membrane protein
MTPIAEAPEGINEDPRHGVFRERLRRWVKILSAYFTAQTLTQLAGIAAGLLFVNLMPVREFALYTLAFSVITFFNFASDLGSSTSLVYFFHQAQKEGSDFAPQLAAVLSLRRLAFLLGAVAVVAAFPRTAGAKGFGLTESLLVTGGILLCVWFQIGSSLRVLALRLEDRYGPSYQAEIAGGLTRLLLAAAMVATFRLEAWLGVLTSAVAAAVVYFLARPVSAAAAAAVSRIDLAPYRRRVIRYLLPTLPSALFFAVQGPLNVWLAATFGGTRNIAEVGALGRLGLLVGIFSSLTGVVFLPRLARIADERLYRRRFLQFGAALAAVALAMFVAAAALPGLFLFLLGKHYSGLHRELLLVVGGAGLTLLDGYAVSVNLARSWTRWQGAAVGSLIAVQALLVVLLPLSTTAGVLSFNLLGGAAALLGQVAILALGFTRPSWVHWQ